MIQIKVIMNIKSNQRSKHTYTFQPLHPTLYTIEASVRLKATMAAPLEVSIAATASARMKEEQEWRWMLSSLLSTGFQQEFGFTDACFHC